MNEAFIWKAEGGRHDVHSPCVYLLMQPSHKTKDCGKRERMFPRWRIEVGTWRWPERENAHWWEQQNWTRSPWWSASCCWSQGVGAWGGGPSSGHLTPPLRPTENEGTGFNTQMRMVSGNYSKTDTKFRPLNKMHLSSVHQHKQTLLSSKIHTVNSKN